MHRPVSLLALSLFALAAPAYPQAAARGPFTVTELRQSFGRLDEALAALKGADGTITIAPGRYNQCAVQDAGRVAFVAEVPGSVVFDRGVCEGKATLVLRGTSARVDGIVFTHVLVDDGNGAGIRIEKGDLVVTNAMFVDNQCGILSADDAGSTISIDHSTFAGLGKDPTGHGAHSVYIGGFGTVKITRSRFERGTGGHYVKIRAPRVEILDNSFDDSAGHATNYMIDLSNGATGRIAGNSFVAGPDKENHSTMITVAPEGVKNSSAGLIVEHNVARLSPGFSWNTTFVGNWSGDRIVVRDNDLADRIEPVGSRGQLSAAAGLVDKVRAKVMGKIF
ncbi:right-handed parallel beta-helix repeat-containing protein [Sphingomonas sp. QA11]|uniref:right-handed parallel beta-helix repeat-containing protein n=1 Tax=Sphingomonas sp. QA11 TaxID=2950605 RepID=UPI00234AFA37|nr:right-handed parallel beta-helix repeat-containing protein [Sphingomonas sp. QA11]WCM25311.1 right-handed parallel beta-helix repeat-containing protein [Sphingomonas sp. QA11]